MDVTGNRVAERHESLWVLAASPAIWAAHFMLCYVTAAIWCAKVPNELTPLGGVRTVIAVYTLVALAGIALIGWIGYRAQAYGSEPPPHDDDTPEDRHRFMGLSTLLLSGLSAIAVIYAALVPLFVVTCQ
jgi:hypothetical protein